MKITLRHALLTLLLIASCTYAQQFTYTGSSSMATLENPVYTSTLLQSSSTQNTFGSVSPYNGNDASTRAQGSVFSNNVFRSTRPIRRQTAGGGGGYMGISGISAYQSISPGNIGSGGASSPNRIGLPPPTPHPDDDDINHQLPVGDATWLLLLLCSIYGGVVSLRRKTARIQY